MYRQRAFIAMSACTTLATVTPLDGLQNMTPSSFYYNIYTTLYTFVSCGFIELTCLKQHDSRLSKWVSLIINLLQKTN